MSASGLRRSWLFVNCKIMYKRTDIQTNRKAAIVVVQIILLLATLIIIIIPKLYTSNISVRGCSPDFSYVTRRTCRVWFWSVRFRTELKENLFRNTTCSEQMVYSPIETTCFGLYWPSGFYNIEEESINAVKTVWGVLIKSLCSPKNNAPISTRREEFSLFIIFSPYLQIALALGTEWSGVDIEVS